MERRPGKTREELGPRLPWRCRLLRFGFCLARDLLFRVRIQGRERLPRSNALVIANHLSWIDHLLLWTLLPPEPRLYLLGASQADNWRFKDWLLRTFGGIIMFERGASWVGKDTLLKPVEVLERGASLLLFPEGDVGQNEGELRPLVRGLGHIVLRAPPGCPVIPIVLCGVRELYWRKEITVVVGCPVEVNVSGLDHRRAVDTVLARVDAALRALLPPYVEPVVAHKHLTFLTHLSDRL